MSTIEIRTATPGDEQLIARLAHDTWWVTYGPFIDAEQISFMLQTIYNEEALRTQLQTAGQQYLILEENKQPCGFASYAARPEDPSICKLHKLYVLPSCHGKGFGRILLDDVTTRVRKLGIGTLELNVNRHNPALGFYKHYGFGVVRQEDIAIGPYWMNDYVMRLHIAQSPVA